MEKMTGKSMDLVAENIAQLKALFPEAVAEGKIDFEVLKALLGEEIEKRQTYYKFTWNGKEEARAYARVPSMGTLRPCEEESSGKDGTPGKFDSENLYIEGDNLEVLKLLQGSYHKRVKMIYIDPPYNTGHDFVYPDNFKDSLANYKSLTGQTDAEGAATRANPETSGRYHTDWLNMMYPRLILARNLLTDDGVIFISIDENELSNLKKLCDDVFGEENFIASITLLCNPKGRSQDKYLANCHEYVLVFSKSYLPADSVSIPKTEDEIEKDYVLIDEKGNHYRELELRNTHRDFGKFNRPKLWYPFYVNSQGVVSLFPQENFVEVYPLWDDGFEGCWTWGKEKANNEINFLVGKKVCGTWKIYRKAYAFNDDQAPLKQVKSIWNDKSFFTERGQAVVSQLFDTKEKIFQAPKSISMLKQCIQMCQSKDAVVLDFFSGASSTAHAVMQLNAEDGGHRKFIMVQLPEVCEEGTEAAKAGYKNICEIGKERIRRAGRKSLELRVESLVKELGLESFAKEGLLERLVPDKNHGGENAGELSETGSLEEIYGGCCGNLSACEEIAQGGDIRIVGSDAAGGSVDSLQYSGRTGAGNKGVHPVFENGTGITCGAGNTIVDLCSLELLKRLGYRVKLESIVRNQQDDLFPDSDSQFKTQLSTLNSKLSALNSKLSALNSKLSALSSKFSLDMGFKVFKLDTSNILPWNPKAETLREDLYAAVNNVLADRSTQDLLYEILLKCNLPLTLPMEERKFGENTIYVISAGALAICLDTKIPQTIGDEIVKLRDEYAPIVPMQVVFRDNGFDDVSKTNVLQILKQAGFEEKSVRTI